MVSIEDFRSLSGVVTAGGLLAALYLLHWQIRLGPRDPQMRAAMATVGILAIILFQLTLAYLMVAEFATTWRGFVSYLAFMLSIINLAIQTRRINTPR